MPEKEILKYLPLSESTCYILLMLRKPMHGYSIMQEIEKLSEGTLTIGPGTLYGAFSTLEKEGLICMVGEEDRRKFYLITEKGKIILNEQIRRLEILVKNGRSALGMGSRE